MDESALTPAEAVTVVLSEKGWVRSAKGHDVDPAAMNYKAGDGFLSAARGRSNQLAVFIDSNGRCYAVAAHTLPSARGQGEPLTGRLKPVAGATFVAVMMGAENDHYLLASDAGYGFVTKLGGLMAKNKNGKAILNVPKGAKVLPPTRIKDVPTAMVTAITTEGRMLTFPLTDLPELSKGKGNKIIAIPSARVVSREEYAIAINSVSPEQKLILHCGQRHTSFKLADLEHYAGERGRRGNKLPRGFQKVDLAQVEDK